MFTPTYQARLSTRSSRAEKRLFSWGPFAATNDDLSRRSSSTSKQDIEFLVGCGFLRHTSIAQQLQTDRMILRQKIQVVTLLWLALLSFSTYHQGTGGVAWVQWLSVLSIMAFLFIFDFAFTNESSFIFDPDADNWRRKVVRCVLNLDEMVNL